MRIGELRAALLELEQSGVSRTAVRHIRALVTQIDCPDDMAFDDFLKLFRRREPAPRPTQRPTRPEPAAPVDVIELLRSSMLDDVAFDRALTRVEADRTVTKADLLDALQKIFDRTAAKKATRADIIRSLSDARVIAVRNEKMGKMLGRRPVAAE